MQVAEQGYTIQSYMGNTQVAIAPTTSERIHCNIKQDDKSNMYVYEFKCFKNFWSNCQVMAISEIRILVTNEHC